MASPAPKPNKIKDLELDLQIKILEISNLSKWTKERDYNFYLQLAGLLEQAQQILNDGQFAVSDTQRLNKKQRLKKICTGCGDYFTCYQPANYDYCRNCAINGNRYAQNQCPECGDGSGVIKFPKSRARACLLCSLEPKIMQKEVKRG